METFTVTDVREIAQSNRDIMEQEGHLFDVDYDMLFGIFGKTNLIADIEDNRLRIIKKATVIFCEIAHCQPFLEGNRTIAYFVGMRFLRRNGFELPLHSSEDKDAIKDLLTRTKEKDQNLAEEAVCGEIESYLLEKVVTT